jgi:serine/threonine protein kinase
MTSVGDSRARTAARAGERIDRFRLSTWLGEGGSGAVFSAIDERERRLVALKILHPSAGPAERARFLREGRIAAAVKHAGVVEVLEVMDTPAAALLVMELVRGGTLRARLGELAAAGRRMPRGEALRIAEHVCHGLAAAHGAGVVHCDVKPENVLLGEGGQVKLIDFGIARSRGHVAPPAAGAGPRIRFQGRHDAEKTAVFGTAGYMSPEQAYGGPLDARADLFSLGVVLHEMITGERPFTGRSAWEVQFAVDRVEPAAPSSVARSGEPRFDALLDRVVRRCLAKSHRDRPLDTLALLHELRQLSTLASLVED